MVAEPLVAERGSGVLSTTFGVGVVLVLLFFASHLLLNLWLISVVDDVATDAAVTVARVPAGEDLGRAQALALERARSTLGNIGDRVHMEFESNDESVVLHVTAPELRLLPSSVADPLGDDGIDRTIVIAREDLGPAA